MFAQLRLPSISAGFRQLLLWAGSVLTSLAVLVASSDPTSAQSSLRQAPSGWVEEEPHQPARLPQSGNSSLLRGSSSKVMLQGGVEHSQELPALPRQFRIGATYQDEPPALPLVDGWYWIPSWLAGDWRRDEETVVSDYDCMTGEGSHIPHTIVATELAQYGVQKDASGGIWHCRLGSGGLADCGSYLSVAQIQKQEPLSVASDHVVIKDIFTELRINKDTHAIIDSAQAESITEYFPVRDGVMKVISSVKIFDEQGMPKRLQNNLSTTMRTKAFAPLNFYKNVDLKDSFKRFLLGHGLKNLIPQ
jgi:hypothetical protein